MVLKQNKTKNCYIIYTELYQKIYFRLWHLTFLYLHIVFKIYLTAKLILQLAQANKWHGNKLFIPLLCLHPAYPLQAFIIIFCICANRVCQVQLLIKAYPKVLWVWQSEYLIKGQTPFLPLWIFHLVYIQACNNHRWAFS